MKTLLATDGSSSATTALVTASRLLTRDSVVAINIGTARVIASFGGKADTRNDAPVVNIPGVQMRFATADAPQARTRGRVLDHIGFDVKDHQAFVRKIVAEGITLDEPVRKSPSGSTITYITDPWGTRIEIIERAPLGPQVQ